MRRIIVGAIAFVLMFAQVPGMVSNQVNAAGASGYTKVWDTKPEDKLAFTPTVAQDGSIYGVGGGLLAEMGQSRLYRVDEGMLTWKSEEEITGLPMGFWPVILFDNLVIAAGGVDMDSREKNETKMLFICYTRDGKKVWDKSITLTKAIPAYQIHDGNLWLVSEDTVTIIDPKNGEVKKEINLSDVKPSGQVSVKGEGDDGEGDDEGTDVEVNIITFTKDTMMLNQLNKIRSFKIGSNFDLKLNWKKEYESDSESSDYGMVMNLLLALQANSDLFIVSEPESTIKCYETDTGKEKWSMVLGDLGIGFFFYNNKNLVSLTLTGTSCYNVTNKDLLWENKSSIYPIAMSQDYIFSGSLMGVMPANSVDIIDMKTGEKVSQIIEQNVSSAVLSGNDVYTTTTKNISKYTKCDPCICDVDAVWKSTGKTTLEADICPLETKEFELVASNAAKKGFVDCTLDTSSKKISFSTGKVRIEAGKSETILVKYAAGLNESEDTTVKIKAMFSCNKELELTLNLKKTDSCKEVLKKQYSLNGTEFNLFGKILVYPELKRSGLFNVKFNGFKGVNIVDGKKVWTVDKGQLDDASDVEISKRDGNLMLCHGVVDDGDFWAGIDSQTGKVIWKRTGGQPLVMDSSFEVSCNGDAEEDKSSIDLFDIHTGKNIITGINLDCYSEVTPICQLGADKYIFNSYMSETMLCCDTTGKIVWNDAIRLCNNWTTYKLDNLYVEKPTSVKEDDRANSFLPFKLSRLDPASLKEIWTVEVVGSPSVIQESKDKVWISSPGGIYCFDVNDGKVLWFDGDDRFGWNDPVIVNNSFCVQRYLRDGAKDKTESNKFLVISPEDGSQIFEKEVKNFVSFEQKDDLLYVADFYYIEKDEMTNVYCFKIADWKLLWTATGKGRQLNCDSKIIFKTMDGKYSWFEEGNLVGQFDTGSGKDDFMDFLRGTPCVNWVGDQIYITKGASLFAVDAKTSKQLWAYSAADSYDQARIIVGDGESWQYGNYYSTPCAIGDKILLTENNKLSVYEPAK